jgi:histidinol phosphatase-like enzyme
MDIKYNARWIHLETLLIFQTEKFVYLPEVVIVDLSSIFSTPQIDYINEPYVKLLMNTSANKSIILMTNVITTNVLALEIVKKKIHLLISRTQLHFLAMFALVNNIFSKPHTGMWKMLKTYYKKKGNMSVSNAIVIGDRPKITIKKNKQTDIDMAFANNIGSKFITIDEYIEKNTNIIQRAKNYNLEWTSSIIEPDIRRRYKEELAKLPKDDIIEKIFSNKKDNYIIFISGCPRCGKTTFANELVETWNTHEKSKNSSILLYNKITKDLAKKLSLRFNIILDAGINTEFARNKIIESINIKSTGIVVIEVYVGIEMAKVFNHASLEMNSDIKRLLVPDNKFVKYKYSWSEPSDDYINYFKYYPDILEDERVMEFRY